MTILYRNVNHKSKAIQNTAKKYRYKKRTLPVTDASILKGIKLAMQSLPIWR